MAAVDVPVSDVIDNTATSCRCMPKMEESASETSLAPTPGVLLDFWNGADYAKQFSQAPN